MKKTRIMRDVFIGNLVQIMSERKDVFFLSADMGARALDTLKQKCRDRFINVGIAEQNLINVAVGLGLEGYISYAYAIAPFLSMRAFEQIRNNVSLMFTNRKFNINLLSVGIGISYDVTGPSHHCFEDIALMRMLPNMMVFSPSDCVLIEKFVNYSLVHKNPKYIRFDGKPVDDIYDAGSKIDFEKGFVELIKGNDTCMVSTGIMTHNALRVTRLNPNLKIGLIDMFVLKPVKEDLLFNALKKYKYIVTLEEAWLDNGGLDSLISNVLHKNNSNARLRKVGFKDKYVFEIGSRNYLHKIYKMDEHSILSLIKSMK
ncbi:MAG: transketolase C-terminal domain-containing protein [Elusimicrobiota bacterium]